MPASCPSPVIAAAATTRTRRRGDRYVDADTWLSMAVPGEGSWWPAFAEWLKQRSTAEPVAPPAMGAPDRGLVPLWPAPGIYVLQR